MTVRPAIGRRFTSAYLWLLALTLLAALLLGGGPGWSGERLLVAPALLLALVALARTLGDARREPLRARLLWLLPLLVLGVPTLQLVPLPWSLWAALPGRAALAADLASVLPDPGWMPFSLTPFQTERAIAALCVPCGIYMAALLCGSEQRRKLLSLVMVVAAVGVLVGLLQLAQGPDSPLYFHAVTNHDDAVGLFANRNHQAIFLASLLPVTMGTLMDRLRHAQRPDRDLRVWALTALLLVLAIGATATRSRIGFALLMFSLLVSLAVAWRSRGATAQSRRARLWLQMGVLLAVVLVLQFTLLAFLQRLKGDQAEDLRWQLGREAVALAAPTAGLGYGIGSFPRVHDLLGDAAATTRAYVNHVHDDYLELWLEGGVVAVLLAAVAVALLLRRLVQLWRAQSPGASSGEAPRDRHRGMKLGAAVALAMLALHSALDYPLRTLALECYAALLVAMLVGSVRPGRAVFG